MNFAIPMAETLNMPELPELHVFSLNLNKRFRGLLINDARVHNVRKINTPDYFRTTFSNTSIKDIERHGKELYFKMANNNFFNVHLMLNGQYTVTGHDEAAKIKGGYASLYFENNEALTISDITGNARIGLNPKKKSVPDAFSPRFTYKYFSGKIKKSPYSNIKTFLIDQRTVLGIGNAYSDEILYRAGVSPQSVSSIIPDEYLKKIYETIPLVLNWAIENILKATPDAINGEERGFMKIHHPDRETTEDGEKIIVKEIGGKRTYFTAKQKTFNGVVKGTASPAGKNGNGASIIEQLWP